MIEFNEMAITVSLEKLAPKYRVAFSFACARRALAVYYMWISEQEMSIDHNVLGSINKLYGAIVNNSEDVFLSEGDQLSERIISTFMDYDPSDSVLFAPAEHAVSSLAYALRCSVSGSSQEAAWAARRAYECTDQLAIDAIYVEGGDFPDEVSLISSPIVQQELSRQARDLSALLIGKLEEVINASASESILDS